MKPYLSVCLNPTLQKTLVFSTLIPDTVNRAGMNRLDASGKGINVSRVLTQLGRDCIHLTQLGGGFRDCFLELCAKDNLNVKWVESNSAIRFCYTLINNNDNSVTELVEEGEKVDGETGGRLLEALAGLLRPSGGGGPAIAALIISGSKAAGFGDSLFGEMVRMVKEKNLPVILDIRGKDLLECLPYKPDIIKPNLFEFAATFAPELVAGNEIAAATEAERARARNTTGGICRELYDRYGTKIVLSRGAKTIWYAEKGEIEEYRVEPVVPVNTIGSGDAFTAGLAAAWCEGAPLGKAVAEGARCGRLNAGLIRPGVIR